MCFTCDNKKVKESRITSNQSKISFENSANLILSIQGSNFCFLHWPPAVFQCRFFSMRHICLFISTDDVSCGFHRADTCGDCTQGNGASWCNGDCSWCNKTNTCLAKNETCKGIYIFGQYIYKWQLVEYIIIYYNIHHFNIFKNQFVDLM